jgi:hypothetical protein
VADPLLTQSTSGLGDYPQSRTDPFLSLWQLES